MKFPIYFLHFWLPKVHVESSTVGSILLAGLILKFGVIGYYRFLISYSYFSVYFFLFLGFLGLLICSLFCFFQSDVKIIVAYSSIVHISFLLLCFSCFVLYSKLGGCLIILVHGYVSFIIFYLLGEFYLFCISRILYFFNSFYISCIYFCFFFIFFLLLNVGFPLRLRFFSELIGFINFFFLYYFYFFLFFFYFLISFYYRIYLLVCSIIGKNYFFLDNNIIFYIIIFIFLSFNFYLFFYLLYYVYLVFYSKRFY